MAIFKVQRAILQQPGIIETPGKIFIEGQAHDASTLAPLFNQGWPSSTAGFSRTDNALPLFPMTNRFWQNNHAWGREMSISFGAFDATLLDSGQGRVFYGYQMVNNPNTFMIGPTSFYAGSLDWDSANFYNLSTLQFLGGATGGYDNPFDRGAGGIFYERDANNVYTLWNGYYPYSNATTSGDRARVGAYKIRNVNPSNRTSTSIVSLGQSTSASNLVLIHESATHFYFYAATSSGSTTTAHTHSVGNLEKATGAWVWRGTNARPLTTSGPAYYPSHAINTSGSIFTSFMGEHAAATGSKISFAVIQFDANSPGSSPTWTNVTPTGAASSPGTLTQSAQLTLRTWAFQSGSNTYICVGAVDNAPNTTLPATDYAIHVYKCATASPTSIQYVSSTFVNASLRPKALLPTSSNFSNIIAPLAGSVGFLYWDAALERYILGSSLSVDPRFIAVDQTGRIWISEANTSYNANLHVVSPTISSTLTVEFQNPSITYSGTTVDTNLLVSAFNFSGARIASSVTLQLDTNSATFADGTTSKTVTTLTTGNLSVPIKIIAAGYVRVLANISI